jgi:Spy/CpxP family protein refolding chaperone
MRVPSFLLAASSFAALSAAPGVAQNAQPSPYAGEESRAIKALSQDEMTALRQGTGMGLARPAELNGYPGPRHVLDMGEALGLSAEQRQAITAIFERMQASARPLGADIIASERALDQRLSSGSITAAEIAPVTEAIGKLQGELRAVHIAAHLETKAVLSAEQVARYRELRGYHGAGAEPHPAMGPHPGMHAD